MLAVTFSYAFVGLHFVFPLHHSYSQSDPFLLQAASVIRSWYLRLARLWRARVPLSKAQRAAQEFLDGAAPALAEWDTVVANFPANSEERRQMYKYRAKYRTEAPQVE